MAALLLYWCELYEKLKFQALCLDVETTGYNGPLSVAGLYQPKDGLLDYQGYVRGQTLTAENLRQAFSGCKMLITFNGISFDIPRIRAAFPGVLPEKMPVIDLYRFARRLEMDTNLRVLENTLGISRLEQHTARRRIAVKLWRRYEKYGDPRALEMLLEYNRQDTVNLYPIAEQLMSLARRRATDSRAAPQSFVNDLIN